MNFDEALVIDLETTGLTSGVNEIIEIAILHVRFKPDNSYDVLNKFHSLARPLKPALINPKAMEKNGITKEMLAEAPLLQEVRGDLTEWWEDCLSGKVCMILGHNFQGFDKGFLTLTLGEAYKKMFDYHAEDTWAVAKFLQRKGLIPQEVGLSLDPLTEYFEIPLQAHRALDDCYGTATLYSKFFSYDRQYPNIKPHTIAINK